MDEVNRALLASNQELAMQLAEEKNTKHLLAIQLTDAQQQIAELTKHLDEATEPNEGE